MRISVIGRMLFVVAVLCLAVGPALADGDEAPGAAVKSGQQIPGQGTQNAEDPGGTNSPGVPSHSDDWGGDNGQPGSGNWGSGQHPVGPLAGDVLNQALGVALTVVAIL